MPPHEALRTYTGFLLRKISMASFGAFAQVCGEYGLHPMHFGMLNILESEGSISQRDLSQRTGVDTSTMVERMDVLEQQGLIERRRRSEDRRAYEIELTKKGRTTLSSLRKRAAAQGDELFGVLNADERSELHRLLDKVASALPDRHG